MGPADVAEEEAFEKVVGSRHMRQWFKLSRAYKMMEARELSDGREYDLVLKLRTDIEFLKQFDLADFAEVSVAPLLYSQMDIVFICSRSVARSLLEGILD